MKPTRANVLRRCAKLGVEFEDIGYSLSITAPSGSHFVSDRYGWHFATWSASYRYNKAQIYAEMLDCLSEGLGTCEPGCECGWDDTEEDA